MLDWMESTHRKAIDKKMVRLGLTQTPRPRTSPAKEKPEEHLARVLETIEAIEGLWISLFGDRTALVRCAGDEIVYQAYRSGVMRLLRCRDDYAEAARVAADTLPLTLPYGKRIEAISEGYDGTIDSLAELRGIVMGVAFDLQEPLYQVTDDWVPIDDWIGEEHAYRVDLLAERINEEKDRICRRKGGEPVVAATGDQRATRKLGGRKRKPFDRVIAATAYRTLRAQLGRDPSPSEVWGALPASERDKGSQNTWRGQRHYGCWRLSPEWGDAA